MFSKRFVCTCGFRFSCDLVGAVRWLQSIKMLRRDAQPDEAIVEELLKSAGDRLLCPECDEVVTVNDAPEDDWSDTKPCEACGDSISAERLSALPNASLCLSCQTLEDRGEILGPQEYCPRCGNIMVMRQKPGGYFLYCEACRR